MLYLKVKVTPRQQKTEIIGKMDDGTIKIRLKAVPEKGKANEMLCGFLAKEYGVPVDCVTVISGMTSERKIIRIKRK